MANVVNVSEQQDPSKLQKKGAQGFPGMLRKTRLKIQDFPPDKPVVFPQTSPILAVNNHTLNQLVPKLKEKMPFKAGGFLGKKKKGAPPAFVGGQGTLGDDIHKNVSTTGQAVPSIMNLPNDNQKWTQPRKEPAEAPPPMIPLNVYETDYVTTTFRTRNMDIQHLAKDVIQELRAWTKDHFLVLAELQWCVPIDSPHFSLTGEDENEVKDIIEKNLEKLNKWHGRGQLDSELSTDGVVALRDELHLGMYRTYAEMLRQLRHKEAEKRHGNVWSFSPGTVSWGQILSRMTTSKVKCTILDLNLVCLRLSDSFVPPKNGVYRVQKMPDVVKPGNMVMKVVDSDRPPPIPKPVVLPAPKTHHSIRTVTKRSPVVPKIIQTRFITVTFEARDRSLETMHGEIMGEIAKWGKSGFPVCIEVVWSAPAEHKSLKIEHGIRDAARALVLPAKKTICRELKMRRVPQSAIEEGMRRNNDGPCMGIFKYYTPKLMEITHKEAAKEHAPFWAYSNARPTFDYINKAYADKLGKYSVCWLNFVNVYVV